MDKKAIVRNINSFLEQSSVKNYRAISVNNPQIGSINEYIAKFETGFNIGLTGIQSCGKSTVINSLIEYPLLSEAMRPATCVATKLVYSDTISIEVTPVEIINTGELKILHDHSKKIPCDQNFPDDTFDNLKKYFSLCWVVFGVTTIRYFTDINIDVTDEKGRAIHVPPDRLKIDKNNPKHLAVLLTTLLTMYVNQNADQQEISQAEVEVGTFRKTIFNQLGLDNITNYIVTVNWNAPILKKGIVLMDLPGLGADVVEGTTSSGRIYSHDEITTAVINSLDAIIFIIEPTALALPPEKDVLNIMIKNAEIKNLAYKDSCIIAVMNMMDRAGAAFESTLENGKQYFERRGVVIDERHMLHPLSAIYGQACYVENGDISITQTQQYHEAINIEVDLELETEPRQTREQIESKYASDNNYVSKQSKFLSLGYTKKSYIPEFKKFLGDYAERSDYYILASLLQALSILSRSVRTYYQNQFDIADMQIQDTQSCSSELLKQFTQVVPDELENVNTILLRKCRELFNDNFRRALKNDMESAKDKFISDVDEELKTLRDNLLSDMEGFKHSFPFRDTIVIRTGGGPHPINYPIWELMLSRIDNTKFIKSFGKLQESLNDLIPKIFEKIDLFDQAVIEEYLKFRKMVEKELTRLLEEKKVQVIQTLLKDLFRNSKDGVLTDDVMSTNLSMLQNLWDKLNKSTKENINTEIKNAVNMLIVNKDNPSAIREKLSCVDSDIKNVIIIVQDIGDVVVGSIDTIEKVVIQIKNITNTIYDNISSTLSIDLLTQGIKADVTSKITSLSSSILSDVRSSFSSKLLSETHNGRLFRKNLGEFCFSVIKSLITDEFMLTPNNRDGIETAFAPITSDFNRLCDSISNSKEISIPQLSTSIRSEYLAYSTNIEKMFTNDIKKIEEIKSTASVSLKSLNCYMITEIIELTKETVLNNMPHEAALLEKITELRL